MFFGDVTRYVLDLWSSSGDDRAEARRVLDFLEEGFAGGDPDVQNLIAVSFLENLPYKGEPDAGIRAALGPQLRKSRGDSEASA